MACMGQKEKQQIVDSSSTEESIACGFNPNEFFDLWAQSIESSIDFLNWTVKGILNEDSIDFLNGQLM